MPDSTVPSPFVSATNSPTITVVCVPDVAFVLAQWRSIRRLLGNTGEEHG